MRCWRHFKHGKHLPQKRRQKSCHAWNYYYRFEAKSISYPFLCGLIFLEKKGHVIHDTMRELISTLTYPFVCAFSPSPKANFYFDNKKKKQKWNHISLSCNEIVTLKCMQIGEFPSAFFSRNNDFSEMLLCN